MISAKAGIARLFGFCLNRLMNDKKSSSYQRASLQVVLSLLAIWFVISFGCGILFRDWLDEYAPSIGGAPFGFWMATQGAIIGFVLILIAYAALMARLDAEHGYKEGDDA